MPDELKEIESLNLVKSTIEENIRKLQATESNLKESIRVETLRKENEVKVQSEKSKAEQQIKLDLIERKEGDVYAREKKVANIEQSLAERDVVMAKREAVHIDLEEKIRKFNQEKLEFHNYKNSVLKELDEHLTKIAECKAEWDKLRVGQEDVKAKEAWVKNENKRIMDRIGELSDLEKRTKIETDYLEGVKKAIEESPNKQEVISNV